MQSRMKEQERSSEPPGLESCGGSREAAVEAETEVPVGRAGSCENRKAGCRPWYPKATHAPTVTRAGGRYQLDRSVIPRSHRRRGISHGVENTQSEIPRSARNDSIAPLGMTGLKFFGEHCTPRRQRVNNRHVLPAPQPGALGRPMRTRTSEDRKNRRP